jgi:hypothetical protein
MSSFYFGLLSHLITATAKHKFEFDVEDAWLLKSIADFYKK